MVSMSTLAASVGLSSSRLPTGVSETRIFRGSSPTLFLADDDALYDGSGDAGDLGLLSLLV